MKQKFRTSMLHTLVAALTMAAAMHAGTVMWHGGPITTPSPIVDQDIDISNALGTNILGYPIEVHAVSRDIVITVTTMDSSITSTVNDAFLCFHADAGRTITMNLAFSLDFIADAALTTPFNIFFQGPGQLIVQIEGGHEFGLLTNNTTVGSRFFLIMDNSGTTQAEFQRNPALTAPNTIEFVHVSNHSMISYLAPTTVASGSATETGKIIFDGTNLLSNTGEGALLIDDGGSVIISGHLVTTTTCAMNANIDLSQPAGLAAIMEVANANPVTSWAGFAIVNFNQIYSPQLLSNPFCLSTPYTGNLLGFVLQANGVLTVDDGAYIIYNGFALNSAPIPNSSLGCGLFMYQVIKDRNGAAFIVDGNSDPNATAAQINMLGESAIYFASDVNCLGCPVVFSTAGVVESFLTPQSDISGPGSLIFDVEGELFVNGSGNNAFNILSLVVSVTGGSVLIEGTSTIFPLRTYLRNTDGSYQRFPKTYWLINNIAHFINMNIKHDDEGHRGCVILDSNNQPVADAEPAYIGGERDVLFATCPELGGIFDLFRASSDQGIMQNRLFPQLGCPAPQNIIDLINSCFLVHTDAAATGLTFRVPSFGDPSSNSSCFKFYSNGWCLDQGTGRCLTLGSTIGGTARDLSHVIDPSAHIDVLQTMTESGGFQSLVLSTSYNNQKVVEGLTYNIQGQDSVEKIALMYASNICVGNNTVDSPSPFPITTTSTLTIAGNYFDIITQGGRLLDPSRGGSTGEGAIFVDTNGIFTILPNLRALIGTMIAKSDNGIVNVPSDQILFWSGVGVQEWELNLTNTAELVVVPTGTELSAYTIDWASTIKDFCPTGTIGSFGGYIPYSKPDTLPNGCPAFAYQFPMINANLMSLPIIQGEVGELFIKNSRIGDTAAVIVDGGLVRELVFLNNNTPGVAATGMVIVQNDGTVGLGNANRIADSHQASMLLGVNGVTLVANGNGQIMLNQDVFVNNLCHILTGTAFGLTDAQQLLITSQVPREFRIKKGGILDLTQFDTYNKRLAIGGQVKVIFEPGSALFMSSGEFFFVDQAQMTFEPFIDLSFPAGTGAASTDPYRVKFWSRFSNLEVPLPARLTFKEDSTMFIPRDALVGIETGNCVTNATSYSVLLTDDGTLEIGNDQEYGGGLQVGDVVTTTGVGNTVDFALTLSGEAAVFQVNSQGFFGTGLGIANKPDDAPNTWLVDSLNNVRNVTITNTEGTIEDRLIFSGDDINAGLIALGGVSGTYTFSFDRKNGEILGGGNMIATGTGTGPFAPIVENVATTTVGIMASRVTLLDTSKVTGNANPVVKTGSSFNMLNFLTMNPYTAQGRKTAVVARIALGFENIGFVAGPTGSTIFRQSGNQFRSGGAIVGSQQAVLIGTAGLALDQPTSTTPSPSLTIINP